MAELDFAEALESPMKEFHSNFTLEIDLDENTFFPHKIDKNVSVRLTYFVDFDSILHLCGNMTVPAIFMCDRCASTFEKNLFLEFDEEVKPNLSENEEDLFYDMPRIKIDRIVRNLVILNFPQSVLCKEDCKGLCPICGTNLNDQKCNHKTVKTGENNPFAQFFGGRK